jgi:hypothetical protein
MLRRGGVSASCSAVTSTGLTASRRRLVGLLTAVTVTLSPGGANRNRATDHSAPETGALREAIHLEPCLQRTFGGSMAYEGIAEPRTFRPTPRFRLRAGLLGKAFTAFGGPTAASKDAEGFVQSDRGRRQCIAIQTIQNRWQVTSGRY